MYPVLLPLQLVPNPLKLDGVTVTAITAGVLTVALAEAPHPLASVTLTVYVPAGRPVIEF